MFSMQTAASQIALLHLVCHLRQTGFRLLDIQFLTPHLQRFGAREVSNLRYRELLAAALKFDRSLYSQPFVTDSAVALQRTNQIS